VPDSSPTIGQRLFLSIEKGFNTFFGERLNPLYCLGAIAYFLLWIVIFTGLYLYAFFETSVVHAYASVEALTHGQRYFGGVLRSLHRYASDALILVVVLHLVRHFVFNRHRGYRWFSWVSGVVILWLTYAAGINGYMLPWDRLSQFVVTATTEWFDVLPVIGGSMTRNFISNANVSDRLFSLLSFMHIGLPLSVLALLWIHTQRVPDAKTNPPRALMVGVIACLTMLSLFKPALSKAPADMSTMVARLDFDWFYLPSYALIPHLGPANTWFLLLGATLLIGGAFTTWLTVSMSRLVRYARLLAAGCPAEPPSRGRDEIGELSRALAQLRNEVDGRAYVEHYVQHLTHEMKSPLAAIHGAAELLAEANLPEAERNRFVANVLTQSERMQTLIDKLLRLAQIEQQRELEAPATFKVQEIFADLEQALSAHAERRNVKLTFTADPVAQLSGDRFLLSLALTNLIQNALDFSPSGGTVTCTATGDDKQIHFAVHDQGPGIPEFADQRIFERFFSLPRPDGTPKSTGLGLPLVHEIAVLHGGGIRLENAVDGGALATLSIPLHGHGQAT